MIYGGRRQCRFLSFDWIYVSYFYCNSNIKSVISESIIISLALCQPAWPEYNMRTRTKDEILKIRYISTALKCSAGELKVGNVGFCDLCEPFLFSNNRWNSLTVFDFVHYSHPVLKKILQIWCSSCFHNILSFMCSAKVQRDTTELLPLLPLALSIKAGPNSRLFVLILMYSICFESCTSSLLLHSSAGNPSGTSQGSSWHMVKTGETCWTLPGCRTRFLQLW